MITPSSGIEVRDGLLYLGQYLAIPQTLNLRESLYSLAHDSLGHFGGDKSYVALRNNYYWPHMRSNLVNAYIPSCESCQHNKSWTSLPMGPLHPLPVPDGRLECIAMDFVGPLPKDDGYNCILTITDCLGSDIQIIPCHTDTTTKKLARIFFDKWLCDNGCPKEIVSDRDKLFLSKFWKHLMALSGI